ncbi:MAG: YndJ family transporter [Sandaracinaceae bacterium]
MRRGLVVFGLCGVIVAALLRVAEERWAGAAPLSRVLLLGVAGVVPFCLAVLPQAGPDEARIRRLTRFVLPVAAALGAVSLFVPTGPGGLWASGWMGFSILAALLGVAQLARGRLRSAPHALSAAALIYLPVGAAWLVAARMGIRPLGFDPMIVTLTAIHFHFAAVGATMLSARTAASLEPGRARRVAVGAGVGIVVAQPVVALGITLSAWLGLLGAALLAASLLALSGVVLLAVRGRLESRLAIVLLSVSALSVFLSMPLAVIYAVGQLIDHDPLGLEWMVRLHGYANAHGVVTCGLLGWAAEDRVSRPL